MKIDRWVTTVIALVVSVIHTFADVRGVRLFPQCPNIFLSWPSVPGETFTVQYRPTLEAATPWITLTNLLPAAVNTNVTSFVHSDAMDCPESLMAISGGGGGSSLLATESGSQATTITTAISEEAKVARREAIRQHAKEMADYLMAMLKAAIAKGDAAREKWKTEGTSLVQATPVTSSSSASSQSMSSGDEASTGFYRVFKTSPAANADYFAIQQNSGVNQLDILGNDSDPDNDGFLLSNVTSASHGSIEYTDNASLFRYTPMSGYFGADSFTYTITNFTGGRATATAMVFVNKAGNSPPTATAPIITLTPNTYTATINPLAGASDPDSNPVTLVAVLSPRLGFVTNISGVLTYTHTTNIYGADVVDYFLTDGQGGLTQASAMIFQTDNDGDGMADEWESLFGLNPASNDSEGNPDGDELPNLGEFLLGTDPRLPDNALQLGITSGTVLKGFVQLPLARLTPAILSQPILLYWNGNPVANSFLSQGADGRWLLNWNTSFLTNGSYTVRAGFQYRQNNAAGPVNVIFGEQKTVLITNEIIFAQLTSQFTDFLLVDATLTRNNADYAVELYDDYGNPLAFAQGTTSNGKIQLYWDLTDGQGNQISFGNIQGKFFVADPGGLIIAAATPTPVAQWFLKQGSSAGNGFVVAWGWNRYATWFNDYREQMILNAVVNILGDPSSFDEYTLAPSLNFPYSSTFRYDTDADKKVLLNSLKDNENFFWFGHGSFNTIAGNDTVSSIGTADVQRVLENYPGQGTQRRPRAPKHPYRLVILNGCETYGSDWATSFGIDFSPSGSTNIVLEYQFVGRKPQAFVGWTAEGEVPDFDTTGLAHAQFGQAQAELFSRWMGGFPLDLCLEFFGETAVGFGFQGQDKWKISGCADLKRHD